MNLSSRDSRSSSRTLLILRVVFRLLLVFLPSARELLAVFMCFFHAAVVAMILVAVRMNRVNMMLTAFVVMRHMNFLRRSMLLRDPRSIFLAATVCRLCQWISALCQASTFAFHRTLMRHHRRPVRALESVPCFVCHLLPPGASCLVRPANLAGL